MSESEFVNCVEDLLKKLKPDFYQKINNANFATDKQFPFCPALSPKLITL